MNSRPQKMKKYASFSEWEDDQSAENRKLISTLKNLIEEVAPSLTTAVKWGQGCWTDGNDPKIFIHTEEDHLELGFYDGTSLEDPHELLSGNGKYIRFIRIYSSDDIQPDAFGALIKQAVKG